MAKNKAERDETGGPDLLLVFLTVLLVVVGVFELYILSCIGVKAVTALKDGAGVTLAASSQSQQTGADEATEPPAGGSASEETPDTSGQETATETEPVDTTEPEPEPETEPVDTTEPEPPAEELAPEPSGAGAETPQEPSSGQETEPKDEGPIVYVSDSGGLIHSISDCSKMKYYQEMTKADADSKGYEYCSNCW